MLKESGLPLPMWFESSSEVLLLFSWWRTRTTAQYVVCCLCCIVFGFISIALKVLRRVTEVRLQMAAKERKPTLVFGSLPVYHNAIRGLVAFANYSWDYMLMLVAMTFNVGIFLSMLGGMALGFLTIGSYLDYSVQPKKISSGCECGDDFSCGCHKGHSCTCCVSSQLRPTCSKENITGEEPVVPGHSGACTDDKTVCGKPEYVGI
ncbi:ctr copper transporter domain-containing protein, putative [Eimeria brunetti]|uniref:Copper transport protein n=1 Tax=Eimeria brunetti TaxID=51314 RepID=U6LHF7_9EIME|nr:ctr copper transporter domain-containing protein, putative [Eimeria brunetti]